MGLPELKTPDAANRAQGRYRTTPRRHSAISPSARPVLYACHRCTDTDAAITTRNCRPPEEPS